MLKEGSTVFGPKGDCQPPNFSIRKEHCTAERSGSSVSITPGKGETFVNGKFLTAKMNLKKGDRVCMASEVMLLVFPGEEMEEMEPEAMFEELQNAIGAPPPAAAEAAAELTTRRSRHASRSSNRRIRTWRSPAPTRRPAQRP